MNLKEFALQVEEYAKEIRHELHMHPEMPLEEKWTSAKIQEELTAMGIPFEIAGKYNVIGKIDCGAGKTIALRADIDALPVEEQIDLPFKSQIPGMMHACGHDAHAAMLLATAKAVMAHKDCFKGTIYLCFQCAEEIGMCADECVTYLKSKGGADHAFGMHISGTHSVGTVDLQSGPRFSGAEIFYIDITGRGGHGSRPDLVIDPIRVACDIYTKITSIPTNRHNMFDTCVVSPCMISGGNRFNIFPDTAHIEGSVRYYTMGDGERVLEKIRHFAEATAEMYGAKAVVTSSKGAKFPGVNDAACTAKGREIIQSMGLTLAPDSQPNAGSDNFAEFLVEFPGFYAMLGSYTEIPGSCGNHHNSTFYVDEDCFKYGIEFFLNCLSTFNN